MTMDLLIFSGIRIPGTLNRLFVPSVLVLMLFLSVISVGCFGVVSNPPPALSLAEDQDTELSGYYYLEGTDPELGGIVFYSDGRWEVTGDDDVSLSGRYLARSGIIYMAEGNLEPEAVNNEASFEIINGGETIIDIDGYRWYLDKNHSVSGSGVSTATATSVPVQRSTAAPVEVTTETVSTPVPTVIMPSEEVTITDTSVDQDEAIVILPVSGTDDLTFTLTSLEDESSGKLKINLEVDSTGRVSFLPGEKPDDTESLQILRATFFAYNTGDVSSGYEPLTLGDVYASGMPYKTRSITVNEATVDNLGAELPHDSASGWLDITKPYRYGVMVADAT